MNHSIRIAFRSLVAGGTLLLASGIHAQNMELSGALTVQPQTTVRITGNVVWNLVPGAQLVNHGTIDLGSQATLVEASGAAITGTGTEVALIQATSGSSTVDAGGLGLQLSATDARPATAVTRGHIPNNQGSFSSIARWFQVLPAPWPEAVLHYDPSELNGNNAATLALWASAFGTAGSWSEVPSTANASDYSVSGAWSVAGTYITAFPHDPNTAVVPPAIGAVARVWPTLFVDLVHVQAAANNTLGVLQLFNARGELITSFSGSQNGSGTLHLAHLAPGLYVLRVNGSQAVRLVKQ